MEPTRRDLLRGGGLAVATGLTGCVGGVGSGGGDDGSSDGLRLESLAVGGSPGGTLQVKPPGTVTLLDFFATWCAPCKPQMKELRSVRSQFGDDELAMRSITNEKDRDAIQSFWKKYEGTWPVLMDPNLEATKRYDARRVPTLLVLDPKGEEVWRHTGLAAADDVASAVKDAQTTAGAQQR